MPLRREWGVEESTSDLHHSMSQNGHGSVLNGSVVGANPVNRRHSSVLGVTQLQNNRARNAGAPGSILSITGSKLQRQHHSAVTTMRRPAPHPPQARNANQDQLLNLHHQQQQQQLMMRDRNASRPMVAGYYGGMGGVMVESELGMRPSQRPQLYPSGNNLSRTQPFYPPYTVQQPVYPPAPVVSFPPPPPYSTMLKPTLNLSIEPTTKHHRHHTKRHAPPPPESVISSASHLHRQSYPAGRYEFSKPALAMQPRYYHQQQQQSRNYHNYGPNPVDSFPPGQVYTNDLVVMAPPSPQSIDLDGIDASINDLPPSFIFNSFSKLEVFIKIFAIISLLFPPTGIGAVVCAFTANKETSQRYRAARQKVSLILASAGFTAILVIIVVAVIATHALH